MKIIVVGAVWFVMLLVSVKAGQHLGRMWFPQATRKQLWQVGYQLMCIFPLGAAILYFAEYWYTEKEPMLVFFCMKMTVMVVAYFSAWFTAWRRVRKAER